MRLSYAHEKHFAMKTSLHGEMENMMKTAKIAALISLSLVLSGIFTSAYAQEAAQAEQAVVSEQYPAPAPDTFGQAQFVLSGNPVVPPRDYAKGIMLPSPNDYKANESGRIYDVVFMGVEGDEMQFEIRAYEINDLQFPATGQTIKFPASQKRVKIRDLTIDINEVTAGSITYTVQPLR